MTFFQNIKNNITNKQKRVIFLSIFILLIILLLSVFFWLINKPVIHINNLRNHTTAISSEQERELGTLIWNTIRANIPSITTPPTDTTIRKDSFLETHSPNGNTYITFLLDIDSIKQTYRVEFSFLHNDEIYPENIGVTCPKKAELKYPETSCTSYDNTDTSIENYLPYTKQEDNYYFTASKQYYSASNEWYIEIRFDSCADLNNRFIKAKDTTLQYLKENSVDTTNLSFELYRNYHICSNL